MKRRLFRISIFLLLGAIINVAVGWGCALWSPPEQGWTLYDFNGQYPEVVLSKVPAAWLAVPTSQNNWLMTYVIRSESFGLTVFVFAKSYHEFGTLRVGPDHSVQVHRAGWPFRALECHALIDGSPMRSSRSISWSNALPLPGFVKGKYISQVHYLDRVLPTKLLADRCMLNSLIFGLGLWALWGAPGQLRKWIRLRRGLCPACGYPVGTSAVCTECGGPVRRCEGIPPQA